MWLSWCLKALGGKAGICAVRKDVFQKQLFTLVIYNEGDDMTALTQKVGQNLDAEFVNATPKKLEAIDMFFFPICQYEHFYVVCFDVPRKQCHILDNSSVGGSTLQKYERLPERLRQIFSQYILSKGAILKARFIQNSSMTRLRMPWRDTKNKVDCAIFAMRHMESYKGGGVKDWDCGLEKGNDAQLSALRTKYCAAIVLDEKNEQRASNLEKAKKFISS